MGIINRFGVLWEFDILFGFLCNFLNFFNSKNMMLKSKVGSWLEVRFFIGRNKAIVHFYHPR